MEKLKVVDGNIVKKIEYTEKYATGIFLVFDNNIVKKNCAVLNIELGENTDPNELKQRVTKLEKTGILTTRILNQHFQYIFKDYAVMEEVERLVSEMPLQSREAMRTAYNITKMDTVAELDFLGRALDNKN